MNCFLPAFRGDIMTENGTRARRRREILRAATDEFSRHGFEGTRIEAVAKRAGIGKSTVYEYYPSKEELLHAVCTMVVEDVLGRVREALDAPLSLRELLVRYYRCMRDLHHQLCAMVPLFTDGAKEDLEEFAAQFCRETTNMITEMLRRAADRGEIAAREDYNTAALMLLTTATPIYAEGVRVGMTDYDQTAEFFLRALGARRSPEDCAETKFTLSGK